MSLALTVSIIAPTKVVVSGGGATERITDDNVTRVTDDGTTRTIDE